MRGRGHKVRRGCCRAAGKSDKQSWMEIKTTPYALLHWEAVPCSSGLSAGWSLLPEGLHPPFL